MKNSLVLAVSLILSAINFVACNDDDNDSEINGIVDSVTISVDGETTGTIEYTYDEKGRVDKVIQDVTNYSREVFLFDYEDNSVIVEKHYTDEDTYEYTYTLEDGLATKYSFRNKTENYGSGYGIFTYAGRSLTGCNTDTPTYYEYSWKDGNIISVKEDNSMEFEGDVTSFDNNASVDLNVVIAEIYDGHPMEIAAYAGILGNRCKNLVLPKDTRWNIVARKGYVIEISGRVKEYLDNSGTGKAGMIKMEINYK